MKNCPNCEKEVPSEFNICWSCSYNFETKKVEGFISNKVNHEVPPKEIDCLRCKTAMEFKATMNVHEGAIWGLKWSLAANLNNRVSFDVYVCPNCEKVELFTPTVK